MSVMRPKFFPTQAEFRAWLERNHDTATELIVGFYKKGSGKPSITWPEAVDEALCFGWIDSVRRTLDDERYTNRFTPRRRGSVWSKRNIERARELIEEGRMTPAGRKAFEARREDRSSLYSYERGHEPALDPAYERELRGNRDAWSFFEASAPSYRRAAIHWVMSAKREETRRRRLATLAEDSARGRRVKPLAPPRA